MQDHLIEFGIKVPDIIAGFAGGAVKALAFDRAAPYSAAVSVVVGALTANYLGEPIAKFLGMGSGAGAFVTGLAAMAICQGVVDAVKKWTPGPPTDKPT